MSFPRHGLLELKTLRPVIDLVKCKLQGKERKNHLRVRVVVEHAVPLFSVEGLEPLPVPPLEQLAHPPVVFPTSALLAAYKVTSTSLSAPPDGKTNRDED